jgi:hypothetical protein
MLAACSHSRVYVHCTTTDIEMASQLPRRMVARVAPRRSEVQLVNIGPARNPTYCVQACQRVVSGVTTPGKLPQWQQPLRHGKKRPEFPRVAFRSISSSLPLGQFRWYHRSAKNKCLFDIKNEPVRHATLSDAKSQSIDIWWWGLTLSLQTYSRLTPKSGLRLGVFMALRRSHSPSQKWPVV